MKYHISRYLAGDFETTISRLTEAFKVEGFGVLTWIDVKQTLRRRSTRIFARTASRAPATRVSRFRPCPPRTTSA